MPEIGVHHPHDEAISASSASSVLLDAATLARCIERIAHQIAERSDRSVTDLVVLGLPTRGVPLAHRLAARICEFTGQQIPVGALDATLYRDDLRLRAVRPLAETVEPDGGVTGRRVLLVDDVLFSGRTVRAALDAVRDLGRPRTVELAVLVDGGHRELPIRADYVGKNVPTSPQQKVRVHLSEIDDLDAVMVDA